MADHWRSQAWSRTAARNIKTTTSSTERRLDPPDPRPFFNWTTFKEILIALAIAGGFAWWLFS